MNYLKAVFILGFLQNFTVAKCPSPPPSPSELNVREISIVPEDFEHPRGDCHQIDGDSFRKVNTTARLIELRRQMAAENVSAYIVLSNDEHQSETVGEHDRRLKYISGFTGSNGMAAITLDSAALWTDGRYFSQAEEEIDCNWILMKMGLPETPKIEDWLSKQLNGGDSVSSDPKICAYEKWLNWKKKLGGSQIEMKLVERNLIDAIWTDENGRPKKLNEPVFVLDEKFSGIADSSGTKWEEKLDLIREDMAKADLDVLVITALDEIAWTLNLRGGDIAFFPVFRSYLIVKMDGAILYIENEKVTPEIIDHLNADSNRPGQCVKLREYDNIWCDLPKLAAESKKIGLPSKYSYFNGINYLLYSTVPEDKMSLVTSPVLIRKDYKNSVEVEGMKASHVRDGLVVCQFLALLEREVTTGSGNWTEMKAVEVINGLRRKQKYNAGISFGTIAAFGKNAASAHYQPTPQTDTVIDTSQLFMLDSGGQYYDGTTDCTRTVHFGTPREIEKEIYTRLLMGCIDVATVTFKQGYTLKDLEILIRAPLYEMGLDYSHGSTHGIGSFLAVHEAFNTTYHINFFGSQEPGYYKENEFGMRLENIITVVESTASEGKKKYLTFDTVTLIPYERKLIKIEMLERKHINWLNNYHNKVRQLVGTEMLCQGLIDEYQWLLRKTEPIGYSQ